MASLKLSKPIVLTEGSTAIEQLTFRDELVSGDLRGIKLSSLGDPTADEMLKIAGRLCAQPDAVMNRLSLADLGGVLELVAGFMSAGQQTGTKPSP